MAFFKQNRFTNYFQQNGKKAYLSSKVKVLDNYQNLVFQTFYFHFFCKKILQQNSK